jgi:hypothetical protein
MSAEDGESTKTIVLSAYLYSGRPKLKVKVREYERIASELGRKTLWVERIDGHGFVRLDVKEVWLSPNCVAITRGGAVIYIPLNPEVRGSYELPKEEGEPYTEVVL